MAENLSNLKIIQLNTNSIISIKKRTEVADLLNRHRPDILLLNETKTNPNHKISFRNYNMIRNDRLDNKGGGGTAILIKRPLKYTVVQTPNTLKTIESTIIKLELNNTKNLLIATVYVSSGTGHPPLNTSELSKIIQLRDQNTSDFIITLTVQVCITGTPTQTSPLF